MHHPLNMAYSTSQRHQTYTLQNPLPSQILLSLLLPLPLPDRGAPLSLGIDRSITFDSLKQLQKNKDLQPFTLVILQGLSSLKGELIPLYLTSY